MYKIGTIQIAILLQILVEISAENNETLEALEKEKGDLFESINTAIDESVRLLKNDNDSDAARGVTYMKQLKEQLKDINATDFKNIEASNNTRRSDKLQLSVFELASIFQKDRSESKLKRDANKIDIQKKIDDWIMEKEAEKQKIQAYKAKLKNNLKLENCPRYGIGKKKAKVARRSNRAKDIKTKSSLPKYPCCRKCCKSSYMGCL